MSLWRSNPRQWLIERLNARWREMMSIDVHPKAIGDYDAHHAADALEGDYTQVSMGVANCWGCDPGGEWGWDILEPREASEKAQSMFLDFEKRFFRRSVPLAISLRQAILDRARRSPNCSVRADELLNQMRDAPIEPRPRQAFDILRQAKQFLRVFATKAEPPVSPAPVLVHPELPRLSHREEHILQALLELGANDATARRTTEEIAKVAEPSGDGNNLKHSVARLRSRGLVDTQGGRGGGCWLTAEGKRVAEHLADQ